MPLIPILLKPLLLCLVVALAVPLPAAAQLLPGLGSAGGADDTGDTGSAGTQVAVDPVALLLQVLQDEEARARLVEQLQSAVPAEGEEAAAEEEAAPPTLAQRIAEVSQGIVGTVTASTQAVWSTLSRAPDAITGITVEEVAVVVEAFRPLLLTIAVTVAVFVTLRTSALPFYRRMGDRAAERPVFRRVGPFVVAGLADFAIVLATWAIGYGVATLFFSEAGGIALRQVLYLNAFLVVEFAKAGFRLILSPSTRPLRPLSLSDWAARRVYGVVRLVTSFLGYGALLVLPLVAETAGYFESRSVAALIWLVVIVYLAAVMIYYRRPVGQWLLMQGRSDVAAPERGDAENGPEAAAPASGRGGVARAIAHSWYWFALAWLFWLLLRVLGGRPGATAEMLLGSGKVAIAVVGGLIVSGLLGRLGARGVGLPQSVTERVPLLESRINRHVPRLLLALRLVILAVVVFYAFDTLDVVPTQGLLSADLGLRISTTAFSVLVILLLAFVAWLALTSWVDYRLNPTYGQATAREQTLLTLVRNAGTIAILALALMFALSEIGVNIGPLIASAGVVGLAIGFGAQKMVQDIITGIFIQFENAINVGDVVSAGGITGAVERLTVRSVSLRDLSGIYHIIPFSSVDTVSNYTRDFSYWVIEMGVAYRENVGEARQAIFDAFDELRAHPEVGGFVLGELEWFGLDSFADSAVMLKARIKTWPAQQWSVGRAYNEILKRIFDERGIEIPFPHRTLYFGEDKQGHSPPLRVLDRDAGGNQQS